jgi:predicted CoA-binding protein
LIRARHSLLSQIRKISVAATKTAEATADLLKDLKAAGYKIVFMKPKFPATTIASYDELILKEMKTSAGDSRPTSSIVRTISE